MRRLNGTRQSGLNRVYWDLRGEPARHVRLRTSPLRAPEITVDPDGWRPAPNAGQEQTRQHRRSLDALLTNDLEAFNRRLNQRGLQGIIRRGKAVS